MAGSSGKQTRSQKLRQNMINMMYLVFIAMLALQISKEVLATLGILSEDMEKSTLELKTSIDSAYNIIDQNSNQDYYKTTGHGRFYPLITFFHGLTSKPQMTLNFFTYLKS